MLLKLVFDDVYCDSEYGDGKYVLFFVGLGVGVWFICVVLEVMVVFCLGGKGGGWGW